MNHQLDEAVRRAESRAAVLQSLKVSYETTSSVKSKPIGSSSSSHQNIISPKPKGTNALLSPNLEINKGFATQQRESVDAKGYRTKAGKDLGAEIKLTPKPDSRSNVSSSSSGIIQSSNGYGNLNATLRASSILSQSLLPWASKDVDVEKCKVWLSDGIHNKSVLLESKSADFSTAQRTIINEKRTRNSRMLSNKKRKALLGSPLEQQLSEAAVSLLHRSWTAYMGPLVQDSALSEAQLQARLYCSEKLGALVVVVRSAHDPSIVGLRGVVVAESKHCFFIANYRKGHRERARKKTSGDQEAQRQTSGPSEVAGKVPAAVVAPEACKETATAEPPRKEIASKQLKVARIVRAHCVLAVQWSLNETGPGGLAEDQEAARRRLLQLLIPAPSDSSSGSSSGSSGAVQLQPSLGQGGGESLSFLLHGEGVSSYFKSRAG